jgi:hypothetical protein
MKQTEMKSNVLQQLIEAMMGETSGKMKPKMVTIDVITPVKGKGGSLDDVLDEASEKSKYEDSPEDEAVDRMLASKKGMSKAEWEDSPEDEAVDEAVEDALEGDEEMCSGGEVKKPRMSLSQFLSRK